MAGMMLVGHCKEQTRKPDTVLMELAEMKKLRWEHSRIVATFPWQRGSFTKEATCELGLEG